MLRIKILFIFLLLMAHLTSCSSEPLKIGVISDIHYLSEQLMDDGTAAERFRLDAGRDMKETPAILDQVLQEYYTSDIGVLFIAGDMTKNGEKQSHIDFAGKLRPLLDKGVRIFVVPGNHDINVPNAVAYMGDSVKPVESVTPAEFAEIYKECGYASAIRRDTASLSYVAGLNEELWLLALDGCKYEEHVKTTVSSGRLKTATEEWMLEVLAEAKSKNITVVSMMHHGLVEHLAFQSMFFPQYLIDDWQRLADVFADNGLKVVFTGHFHANDIVEYKSDEGNVTYDIETGSLATYPYPYRFAELTPQGISIQTRNVLSIPQNPTMNEDGKMRLKNWASNFAAAKFKSKGLGNSPDVLSLMADIASDIILLHVKGDEVIDEELKEKIRKMSEEMDMPAMLSPENLQLDFPPADNDVELKFR